ncbi:MAG TPA: M20/M25/M40 family metallo-hydrolase [Thermoanaerobaculia bacterium]|jgi:putative aminopeptidase FrvX|nr:M20/M25/M40 family metallo-hydrolase [Thermoanaerobaculia bacterium]
MRHPSPIRQLRLSVFFLLYGAGASLPAFAQAPDLTAEVEAFLQVQAVAGREEEARDFVRQRLPGQHVEQDAAGNLVLTLGSGTPRRLVVCPLGEPGLIVSRITPEGYLRVVPVGNGTAGALWAQSFEGNVVIVGGARGWVPGGVAQRSVHLMQGPRPPDRGPFSLDEAWIDVGTESAAEVEALGIRLLDPVALIRRPARLAGGRIAGPSARLKGACTAMLGAARALGASPPQGTVVFAWTTGDFVNGIGLVYLLRSRGPFDEVLWMSPGFGLTSEGQTVKAAPLPVDGSGLLSAGEPLAAGTRIPLQKAPYVAPEPAEYGQPPSWAQAKITALGLPARYPQTPVETIFISEVGQLRDLILAAVGRPGLAAPPAPALPSPPLLAETTNGHADSAPVLAALIGRYGVSGAEGPVREEILHRLPSWAKPAVDGQGNIVLTVGQGKEHVLFAAHLDEVGFAVAEILPDGRLRLENRGGMLRSAWEAQAALVHGDRGPVPAVFEPRADWRTAEHAATQGPLTVWTGASSPTDVAALGIHTGSTVTMPKRMFRIGPHRALARGFDDRAGCTSLLLALAQIDPAKLTKRITFAWDVEEEIGLNGSTELAKRLTDLTEVHAIDTFVSSDSPRESDRFAFARLGHGPVLRAMDNASLIPRDLIERFQGVAARAGVPVQVGFTGGATDGMPFLAAGVTMLPFSWPGRSSHSPVEVADLRDVENLARLIVAVATQGPAK